jgi:hypothetical protein
MIIAVQKDTNPPVYIQSAHAISFFRAFRCELWATGIQRDPQVGDELLGVRIVGLTL